MNGPSAFEIEWACFATMIRIRRLEETVYALADEGAFPGHYHLYIGQEATGAGAISALTEKDFIATTHRNHGHLLARGAPAGPILAEILGRDAGLNRGRGGTLHVCDPERGFIQTSAMVGGAVALSLGAGFACRQLGEGAVTACFFGDGALEEGICFETMNVAALWKLPIVYVCENNSQDAWGMALGGYPALIHASNDLRSIPGSLGIEAIRVEGVDPIATREAMQHALDRCRAGAGPIFIEALTRRWAGSAPLWPELSTGITDLEIAFGDSSPAVEGHDEWFEAHDPVLRLARKIVAKVGPGSRDRLRAIDAAAVQEMNDAKTFALESPYPDETTAGDFVFSGGATS